MTTSKVYRSTMHYIRNLGEYAAGIPDGVNLGLSDIQVTYVCQGGMTLRPRAGNRWIRDHLTEVTSSCPSVIVLHIGENDLGSLPASEVAGEILQLAWDLRRDYRCLCIRDNSWPGRVIHQRDYWTSRRSTPNCFTPGLGPTSGVILDVDSTSTFEGVHLSPSGMEKYYQRIRTCVGRAIRHQ